MANEFYITAGFIAIDSVDIGTVGTNAFYITAGLVADDYVAAAGALSIPVAMHHYTKNIGGI